MYLRRSIFVNRYRDTEAVIRTECISALGTWMKTNPDHWLEGDYLRYLAWVLSDESPVARREVVRALFALYAKDDHIGTMHNFTERFKGRIVEMGTGEVDPAVRVQAIQVLRQLEHHGLLEDDQRDAIARLVFEKDKRVRGAAADFFSNLLGDEVERRKTEVEAGRPAGARKGKGAELKQQLDIKVLAELLVKYGKALDGTDGAEAEEDEDKLEEEVELVEEHTHKSRIELVVEGLWDDIDAVRDWRALIDYLLLDHSSSESDTASKGKKRATKGRKSAAATDDDDALDEGCKLTDEEETLLVELLVAALDLVTKPARLHKDPQTDKRTVKQKEDAEEAMSDVSRALMDSVGRLFAKHQVVPSRMVDVLAIPRLYNLDLYLDMRRISHYEALWDDVTKQFLQHTHPDVIDQAVQTIAHLQATRALSQTNEGKLAELGEATTAALRDILAGKDVESAVFEEDERLAITAALGRVSKAYAWTDLGPALVDTDGDRQSSAWEIVDAVSLRGRLGYKDETVMVQHALDILSQHVLWSAAHLLAPTEERDGPDLEALATIVEKRAALLDRLEEFAIGQQANTTEEVKKTAVVNLVEQHLFAKSITDKSNDPTGQLKDLRLKCSEELQARCAGFLEAAIGQHVADLAELDAQVPPPPAEEESDDEGGTQRSRKGKSKKKKAPKGLTPAEIRAKVELRAKRAVLDRRFEQTVTAVVHAICGGVFSLEHAVVVLPHVGRFGHVFEGLCKMLADELKVEATRSEGGGMVAGIVRDSIVAAVEAYAEQDDDASPSAGTALSDDYFTHLGRFLVGAIAVRGTGFSFAKTLPAAALVELHTEACAALASKLGGADKERALAGWRALGQLLVVPMEGRRALEVKGELERVLGEVGVGEVPGTARGWEPVRGYVKRLATLMSKDPGELGCLAYDPSVCWRWGLTIIRSFPFLTNAALKRAAEMQVAKNRQAAVTDDERDDDEDGSAAPEADDDDNDDAGVTPKASRVNKAAARKAATPASAKKRKAAVARADDGDEEEEEEALPQRKKRASEPAAKAGARGRKRGVVEEESEEEDGGGAGRTASPEDEIEEVEEEEGMEVDEERGDEEDEREEVEGVETTQERAESVESVEEVGPKRRKTRR